MRLRVLKGLAISLYLNIIHNWLSILIVSVYAQSRIRAYGFLALPFLSDL